MRAESPARYEPDRTRPDRMQEVSRLTVSVIRECAAAAAACAHAAPTAAHRRALGRATGGGKGRKAAVHLMRFAGGTFQVAVGIGHPPNLLITAAAGVALVLINRHTVFILRGLNPAVPIQTEDFAPPNDSAAPRPGEPHSESPQVANGHQPPVASGDRILQDG